MTRLEGIETFLSLFPKGEELEYPKE